MTSPGMSLQGRTILITGAGRGLGLAIADRLGAAGATLWLADIRAVRGESATAALRDKGFDASFVPVDIGDEDSVDAMAQMVTAGGPVYGLVNNAALADGVGGKLVHELSVQDWDRVTGVNLRGTFLVSRAIVPSIIAGGGGRVVMLGSDAALYGSPRLAHYIASKGGIAALARAMSRDLGPHAITVNTVAPGLTETEAAAQIPAQRHELYRLNRSLQRPQQPADVVGAVAFLLGDEASYITGQQLVVNGGFVLN